MQSYSMINCLLCHKPSEHAGDASKGFGLGDDWSLSGCFFCSFESGIIVYEYSFKTCCSLGIIRLKYEFWGPSFESGIYCSLGFIKQKNMNFGDL